MLKGIGELPRTCHPASSKTSCSAFWKAAASGLPESVANHTSFVGPASDLSCASIAARCFDVSVRVEPPGACSSVSEGPPQATTSAAARREASNEEDDRLLIMTDHYPVGATSSNRR